MRDDERDEMPEVPEALESTVAEIAHSSLSTGALVAAFVAGLVAAIVAGAVWGYVVKATDYEIGIAAWGVGLLAGLAVVAASRGRKGPPLQVIAVLSALVGIFIGKYLSFAFVVRDEVPEAGLFSAAMRDFFMEEADAVFSLFDILWIGLAVMTAWRLTRPDEPAAAAPGAA